MTTTRELIKGPPKPPPHNPSPRSYTQAPPSKDEITIRKKNEKPIPGTPPPLYLTTLLIYNQPVREFASDAAPQPFLDPTIIQRRMEAEKQWKIEQEKKASSSRGT